MILTALGRHISFAPLIDHLWQSTLVALLAALLVLALRHHRASLRYWIWFVASMKFLLPFALLIHFGQALRPASAIAPVARFAFAESMDQFARPFSQPHPTLAAPQAIGHFREFLPYVLLAVWLCGAAAILSHWTRKRRRISRALRTAKPSTIHVDIPVLVTASSLEPGVFGLFQPVLLLPAGIAERLSPPQLRAILAHEICHVRRRDNLTSALHMLVEALFWFHPFVWWIGSRLVDERERACDEHVLALGSDPQLYAESILKVCNFYLESPLPCAAGVTGSHLKQRIEAIMNHRIPKHLRIAQKLLLASIAAAALVVPLGFGVLHAAQSPAESESSQVVTASFYNAPPLRVYESVSVRSSKPNSATAPLLDFRPDGLTATNVSLQMLIQQAYGVAPYQIAGAPDWLNQNHYDVEAKVNESLAGDLAKGDVNRLSAAQQPMLLELLADRFQISVHRATKQLPAFALVVSKTGSKLHEATPGEIYPYGPDGIKDASGNGHGGVLSFHKGRVVGQGIDLAPFIKELSGQLGRPVLDRTGLTGKYDFALQWSDAPPLAREYMVVPGTANPTPNSARLEPPSAESAGLQKPSIFAALHDQLGLELVESREQTVPTQMLVIDHAEPPALAESNAPPSNVHAPSSDFASVTITPNKTGEPMDGFNVKGRPMQAVAFRADRFMATNFPLRGLIRIAYGVPESRILDGPGWIDSEKFDVEAKLDPAQIQELAKLSPDQRNLEHSRLIQGLLADRFRLVLHRDTKQLLGYALVIAADGPKIQKAKPGDTYPDGLAGPGGRPIGGGTLEQAERSKLVGQGIPLSDLAKELSQYQLNRPVVDLTGLTGNYDFTLQWTASADKNLEQDTSSILAAIQKQLGLQLKLQSLPTDVLIVDSAQQPPAN
jgi:bla regulator protein blaR1